MSKKTSYCKKALVLLIAFMMVFTMMPSMAFADGTESDAEHNAFFAALKVGTNSKTLFQPEKDTENANSYIVAVPFGKNSNIGIYLKVNDGYEGTEQIQILKNATENAALKDGDAKDITKKTLSVDDLNAGIYVADFTLSANGNGASFNIKLDDKTYQINVKRLFTPTVKAGIDNISVSTLKTDKDGNYTFSITEPAELMTINVGGSGWKYVELKVNDKSASANKSQSIELSELDIKDGSVSVPIEIKPKQAEDGTLNDVLTTKYYVKVKLDFDHIAFSHDADGTESYQLSPQFSTECKDYTLIVPNTYEKIYVRGVSSKNDQMKAKYSGNEVNIPNNYKYTELTQCISEGDSGEEITFQIGTESYNITIVRNPTLNNLEVKAGDKTLRLDRTFSKGVNQYYAFVPETAASVSIIGNYDANAYKFFVGDAESVNGSTEYSIDWGEDNKKTLELRIQSIHSEERSGSYQLTLVKGDSDTPFIVEEKNFEKAEYTKTQIKEKNTKQMEITAVVPNGGSLSYQWERLYDGWAAQEYIKIADAQSNTFRIEGDKWAAGTWKIRCKVTNTVGKEQYEIYSNECEIYVDAEKAEIPTFRYLSDNPKDYKLMLGGAAEIFDATVSYSDGGSAEYQWYVNDSKSTENGTAIEEAKTPIFTPPTDNAGTNYYYCVVVHKVQTYTATITSTPIKVEVVDATALLNDKGIVGEGTAEAPFEIYNEQDLTAVRELVGEGCSFDGSYFLLKQSIELSSEWKPIGQIAGQEAGFDLSDKEAEQYTYTGKGTKLLPFSGIFDGNQNTITTADGGLPLFGVCRNASVKNLYIAGKQIAGNGLVQNYVVDYGTDGDYNTGCPATITIENVTIKSGTSTLRSGFLSGYASGANTVNIVNCVIEDDVSIGYNKDQSKIGSFAGQFNGNIINSKSAADVYGVNAVGGLVGCKGQSMGPCTVKTSSFTGNVYAGGSRAGGIIGSGYDAESAPNTPVVTIRNCFVAGNITGTTEVGGILGSEPVCEDCWANGQGSIIDNVFYGKLTATGRNAYIGGIIGFMKSYNANQTMDNNYYVDTCGVSKGIGKVEIVDVPDFDLSKCGTAATENEMSDGTIVKKLNNSATSFKNWKQGSKHPVHTADAVAYEITISGKYKTEFYTGDSFDSTGIVVTANYSDGSSRAVDTEKLVFSGFSSDSVGYRTITVKYGALETSYEVKVIYKAPRAIEAYISIYGDSPHGESGTVHTLKKGGLTQWIAKTSVTIDQNTTVRDILEKIALRNGIRLETNPNSQYGYYVEGMTRNGIYLAEFTNGKNSGWMYTVNGTHPQISAEYYFVKDGDEIVWHYTDDYTIEEGSELWGVPGAVEEVKEVTTDKTASTTTSPTDVKVSEKTNADGTKESVATVTVSAENQKEILAQAKANKSKEIILQVSKDAVKDATKADVQLDKSFIESVLKDTDAKLTVKTPFGDKTYTQDELKALAAAATGKTVSLEIVKSEKTDEELKAEQLEAAKATVAKASMKARSTKTAKGNVKIVFKPDTKTQNFINEMKDMGYTVKYRFYRSTKKSSGYKAMLTKTSKTYTNTSGKAGTRYYYKVQVRVYDENGKCVAKTALKQCKYATRIFG